LSLESNTVSASIFYGENLVRPGQLVRLTGPIQIIVGDNLLGRVVDPLGNALDSLSDILSNTKYPMESIAPSIISRKSVNVPLTTGLK
jgi:F-type H+-transporting ATPase subunit alpha